MKIRIAIWSYGHTYSIYSDDTTQVFNYGTRKVPFSKDFLNNAINIVKTFPDVVEDPNVFDGIKYKIAYDDNTVSRQVIGNNSTPKDWDKLMMLIDKHDPMSIKYNTYLRYLQEYSNKEINR